MDLIDDRAIQDDEEEEESFDEETGEPRRNRNGANGHFDDSSEEEDDDDDEEAAKAIAEGFIVDEDEDEEEARQQRRRERKKRRREEREREDEGLDDEDLELIGLKPAEEATEPKFKRLKRGPREEREEKRSYGVNDIFRDSDEEEEAIDVRKQARLHGRGPQDEFDDFIEDDVFSDEEQQRRQEDAEVARPRKRGLPDLGIADAAGLDEQAMEDFREAFGDGTDYDFALQKEEEADYEEADRDKHLDLKDVFEHSQLAEKLLTDDDNIIRAKDEPERHQLARKPYMNIELSEEETKEEAIWISKFMLPKKRLDPEYNEPFRRAVAQVLDFMVRDNFEVPFIFQHRKDYLIHAHHGKVEKLINQNDLWDIFDRDLKFRALIERRQMLQRQYDDLKSTVINSDTVFEDLVFEEMLPAAQTMEELQDVQDYLHFQYASQMKDLALTADVEMNGTGMSRKKAATRTLFEEIRAGRVYSLVRAFGITADAVAKNALEEGMKTYAEDPSESPENLADTFIDEEFSTGTRVLKAAKAMFVEEFVQSPRFRRYMRRQLYQSCVIDCNRTEKGLRRIDEQHPFYEFKYLRNQDLPTIADKPDLYLKMLKAEEEGLIEVHVRMPNKANLKKQLNKTIVTDNYSTIADAWNAERRDVLSIVVDRLESIMGKYVKEQVKTECEEIMLKECREEFNRKLDQAPYQPRGMKKGTTPRVLTMSIGGGNPGRDPICWAYVSDDGRIVENGRFVDLAPGDKERGIPDGKDVANLLALLRRRETEVIGVAGWSPDTRKLSQNLETIVKNHDLTGPPYTDDDDRDRSDPLEVIIVNDEIARLYRSSDRAKEEHPSLPPLTLYCVALARYMQDPLKEYASLGRDLVSISFHPAQHLISQEKLIRALETALIDNVNLVGVDLDEATSDSSTANLLTYVCGLGPRKAAHLLKAVNMNQNYIKTRFSLLEAQENHAAALGPKVWSNAASFLFIRYDNTEDDAEFLDSTRIHPEDYDIARKMAADALELDEEDIEAETREFGNGAIVRRLVKEEAQDRVNDLVLEEYAEQLEKNLNARKRATLENITAEINDPYEELRNPFSTRMGESELFTMLTGETRESLQKGMTVPMQIKRVTDLSVEGRLDSGLEAHTMDGEASDTGASPKQLYAPHQTVQAHILSIDRKNFTAGISLRDEFVKRPFRRFDKGHQEYDEWDGRQEAADKKLLEQKTEAGGRVTRVIKHPLFRPFNSKQAEEYLGSQNRGDVLIRPSSKGTDHLAVTWKVADGVFQHIDVLELDKENEFSLGKTLRVGGRYNYSDLDELIVMHVKTMARKVDEMMNNEKFQDKTKTGLDEWLTTYTNANPKRSMYQFCTNREKPGNFHLCFKAGQKAKLMDWNVRVIPQGFELMKQPYPTMRDLCNGFKLIFGNMQNAAAAMGHAGRR